MNKHLSMLIFSVTAVFALSLASEKTSASPAFPPLDDQQEPIRITAEIPRLPENMALYKLAANRAPVEFFNEKLQRRKLPTLKLDNQYYTVRSGQSKEEGMHAFIDMKSGDAEFVPHFSDLVKAAGNNRQIEPERVKALAVTAFQDERFIPKDVTEIRPAEPIVVFGGSGAKGAGGASGAKGTTEAKQIFTIVPVVRYAGGFPVYGLGSHAALSYDNDGEIVGAVRRWRSATAGDRITPVIKSENVRSEILRQLEPLVKSKGTTAIVDKIEVAYYDNNKDLLQPVYHFEATVKSGNDSVSPVRVSGFIPIGSQLEPIPDLTRKTDAKQPAKAVTPDPKKPRNGVGSGPTPDDITLGEYCNRDWPNNNSYITMSYAFLNGLTYYNSVLPGWTPPVTRTQWYDAWPWEVVGPASKSYMNAVNVAYTVPHGNWLLNTTLSNDADLWYVNDIGTGGNPGFGAAAGGVLATWVIMSCEVIPSYYDRANEAGGSGNGNDAFKAWWPVFQGLHNVLGFRTEMWYPDNETNMAFGMLASLGVDVNAAWFQEVAAYHSHESTYNDGHLQGNPLVHYDRACSMIDGRDLGQSIFSVGAQTASTSLWNFWMGN